MSFSLFWRDIAVASGTMPVIFGIKDTWLKAIGIIDIRLLYRDKETAV